MPGYPSRAVKPGPKHGSNARHRSPSLVLSYENSHFLRSPGFFDCEKCQMAVSTGDREQAVSDVKTIARIWYFLREPGCAANRV